MDLVVVASSLAGSHVSLRVQTLAKLIFALSRGIHHVGTSPGQSRSGSGTDGKPAPPPMSRKCPSERSVDLSTPALAARTPRTRGGTPRCR
eukprot:scaffold214625_cov30-Tisochrysis_lutea.AAC.2